MRVTLTNGRIMVHQPSGGAPGMAADIEIQARESLRMRTASTCSMRNARDQSEEIERRWFRDKFMESDEAKIFGIIDEVFDKRPDMARKTSPAAARRLPKRRRPLLRRGSPKRLPLAAAAAAAGADVHLDGQVEQRKALRMAGIAPFAQADEFVFAGYRHGHARLERFCSATVVFPGEASVPAPCSRGA